MAKAEEAERLRSLAERGFDWAGWLGGYLGATEWAALLSAAEVTFKEARLAHLTQQRAALDAEIATLTASAAQG